MRQDAIRAEARGAHIIVIGNEKGGSGKSTVAQNLAIALLKSGHSVATIDLDCRQRSLTRFLANRTNQATDAGRSLELSFHRPVDGGCAMQAAENEEFEFRQLTDALGCIEGRFDYVVIDTPGKDTYLMRLAHFIADTLVTPMNDSFLDLELLGVVDVARHSVISVGSYAQLVREARRARRGHDGATIDWIVVRNRLSMATTRNHAQMTRCLERLSSELGFRPVEGFVERSAFKEFFPRGMTPLDVIGEPTQRSGLNPTFLAAREEVYRLLRQLRLPIDERGRRRAANRAEWFDVASQPMPIDDIVEPAVD